jgi:hypothetical protein
VTTIILSKHTFNRLIKNAALLGAKTSADWLNHTEKKNLCKQAIKNAHMSITREERKDVGTL